MRWPGQRASVHIDSELLLPKRLARLPRRTLASGLHVAVASSTRARLLGLAGLHRVPPGVGLLLPRCRSVHTFGMRVPLDIVFTGAGGEVVALSEAVGPGHVAGCRRARAVLEVAAGEALRYLPAPLGTGAIEQFDLIRARSAWRGSPS